MHCAIGLNMTALDMATFTLEVLFWSVCKYVGVCE